MKPVIKKDKIRKLITEKEELNKIFDRLKIDKEEKNEIKIPEEVLELVEKRKKARQEKNWTESDRLRDEIQNLGYSVKDTKDGVDILKN